MTTPDNQNWGGQPPHGQWPQQTPPPGYYQPTTPQPAYQPGYQQGWDQQLPPQGWEQQQNWNQPQPQWDQPQPYGYAPPPPAAPKGRGKLIALSAAVVVLAGGGVATYAAVSSSDSTGGANSPRAAVDKIVTDINNNDLIGVLEDLPPGERNAITKPFLDTVDQLKRTQVLRKDADLHKFGGVSVAATNLTFAAQTVTINDHVQIVQLTGGSVHVTADAAQLPFTSQFVNLAAPSGLRDAKVDRTVDLGKQVRSSGRPIRIATQQVGGRWYPSLMYTIADNAVTEAHLTAPTSSIPANGASSADEAVREYIDASLQGRIQRAIELTSPDELLVLHDYGSLVVDRLRYSPAGVSIGTLTLSDSSVSGGTRVSVKAIEIQVGGRSITVKLDGDCIVATSNGETKRFCGSNISQLVSGSGVQLTPDQSAALSRAFTSVSSIGVVATQSGGKWYVNPVRSYFDLSANVLSKLQDGDLLTIIGIFRNR